MIARIRERILAFISSPEDVPLLAGFSVGFYMLLFYYSQNFSLANSTTQILLFTAYYMLLPMAALYVGYKLLKLLKLDAYRKNFLFVGIAGFFSFFLIQLNNIGYSKLMVFGVILLIAAMVSFWLRNYYKLFILLLFLMSLFNVKPLVHIAWLAVTSSSEWKEPDSSIKDIVFKERPNIYYIQPDGYTSFSNLKEAPYNFDNTQFESFLTGQEFTLYPDFRSNYISTLLSNSSMFNMMHHYSAKDVDAYAARNLIVSENNVLDILKKNNYKTHFLTEKPYLVINRPEMGYDYCNVEYSELPFIRDGWGYNEPLLEDFMALPIGKTTGNFYFLEKMSPNHIEGFKANSRGIAREREKYLQRLNETNAWLIKVITHINSKDPDALIVIAADHGGYVGFDYTMQAYKKTNDKKLAQSIFGAALTIKWNREDYKEYEGGLVSSVNLFTSVFAYLAKDKRPLQHLQENGSYIRLTDPKGLYRYINNKGEVVLEKANDIQD